jgi:hypothetical protein
VNWTSVGNADSYLLQEADNMAFTGATTAYSGAATQAAISGKADGTYYYRVRATNSEGDSDWSNVVSVYVGPIKKLFLPVVLNGFFARPAAPLLAPIANPDGDGNFVVAWNAVSGATSYTLHEDDNASFTSPTIAYTGANNSWNAAAKPLGKYYYRVQASNTGGNSAWSNTVSVDVTVATAGVTPGFWDGNDMEFYVLPDGANVDNFAIFISVTGCGNYKITSGTVNPIVSNAFTDGGPFYYNGVFGSATTASGQLGLASFPISGCGNVSGGPFPWSATWMNSSQPSAINIAVDGVFEIDPTESNSYPAFDVER